MAIVPLLLSLLVVGALYASLAKIAAYVFRRTKLSWKAACGLGALLAPVALLGTILSGILPTAFLSASGIALGVAIGAWFLSTRATDPLGQPVGFKAAALLSTIAISMAFVLGVVAALAIPALPPR